MLQMHLVIDDFHPDRDHHLKMVRKEMRGLFHVTGYGNIHIRETSFSETDIDRLRKDIANIDILFIAAPEAMHANRFESIANLDRRIPLMVLGLDKSRKVISALFQHVKYLAVVPSHDLVKPDDIIMWARMWGMERKSEAEIDKAARMNNPGGFLEMPKPRLSIRPDYNKPGTACKILHFPAPGKRN